MSMDIGSKPRAFRWDARYETGLPEVDAQHRALVAIINRLVAALDGPGETDAVRGCVAELVHYASRHFETEEALMESWDIGGEHEAGHVQGHRRFAGFVLDKAALLGSEPGAAADIARFLVEWLAHHILHTDHKMAALIRAAVLAKGLSRESVLV